MAVRRNRRRWLAAALLLVGWVWTVTAQTLESGSLAGKLTDLRSQPLGGATVVVRNAATGQEVRTTTAKNGSYRFSGLTPGEYTLEASSKGLGRGTVEGITVASGHEARVQAAVELSVLSEPETAAIVPSGPHTADSLEIPGKVIAADNKAETRPPQAVAATRETVVVSAPASKTTVVPASNSDASDGTAGLHNATVAKPMVTPQAGAHEGTTQIALAAPARGSGTAISPLAIPSVAALSIHARGAAVAMAGGLAAQAAAEAGRSLPQQILASAPRDVSMSAPASVPLGAEQLQQLPFAGRRWQDFVLNTPASSPTENDGAQRATSGQGSATAVTVDGANTNLAFGKIAGMPGRQSSLIGAGVSEGAMREVQMTDANGMEERGNGQIDVRTRSGTPELHGQMFGFERSNLWGAENPFTQWVKETAPAAQWTIPVFTPLAYSPPDREETWGVGVGGVLHRQRLFWFGALDGRDRNDPGVASVKHPDNFFAQPTNDQMQMLSARLGQSSAAPIGEGVADYSALLESLDGLLGPAARTATEWLGFARLDWKAAERHQFTLEGTGAVENSPGGGVTRTSATDGNHSFGSTRASEFWLLGRWEAFATENLLAVTQASVGLNVLTQAPETPSAFEQTLNASAWGQLPQIVVDSRYGMTIGNPARFGAGSYPDEHLYEVREGLDWVHGPLLVHAGLSLSHNRDATAMVPNHTGTYHYANVENFASDALVFQQYGMADALDATHPHNCDETGKAWRDTGGVLHGLGNLPCYSYYTQTMGPADWYLSTNDWAGFVTAQWQPAKRLVFSAALRWDREQLPPPIALVNNADLPLTQRLPDLGNQWGPRVSLAWGSGESHWPVVRLGYGLYFGRTNNAVLETALTHTGSLKGDLDFFMRPTDNLYGVGAPPFPYVLAGEPGSVEKPGAVELAPTFRNPEVHQGVAGVEEMLPGHVQVSANAMVSLGRRLPVSIDTNIDSTQNPGKITYAVMDRNGTGPIKTEQITVPFFASWPSAYAAPGQGGRLNANYQQITELFSEANSTYEAAMVRVMRNSRRGLSFHGRYIYAHAMDWNPNESDQVTGSEVLDPTNLRQEYGTSDLDMRHSAAAAVIWNAPWKLHGTAGKLANGWMLSGVGQYHSGSPYTMRTEGSLAEEFATGGAAIVGLGPGMNGYGGDNRVYGVGRNTYRYPQTWKANLRVGRKFEMGRDRQLELMAESFNLLNHQNVTELETTGYTIEPGTTAGELPTLNFLTGLKTGQTEFGMPLNINATDFFRERQIDFGVRLRF
jgi:hypothetical protein